MPAQDTRSWRRQLVVFVVQIIAGIVGGIAAGAALHEHSLGTLTNTIAGIVGGLAGYAVYAAIPAMVNGAGNAVVDTSFVNELALRALSAFIAGGVLALIVTFREYAVSSTQTEMSVRPLEEDNVQYCDLWSGGLQDFRSRPRRDCTWLSGDGRSCF